MVGLQIPAIPVEHQYIVTDVDPVLKAYREAGHAELPILRESDCRYYLREERLGWILGPYEKGAPARSEEHTSELQSLMRISYAVFCLKKKKSISHDMTEQLK